MGVLFKHQCNIYYKKTGQFIQIQSPNKLFLSIVWQKSMSSKMNLMHSEKYCCKCKNSNKHFKPYFIRHDFGLYSHFYWSWCKSEYLFIQILESLWERIPFLVHLIFGVMLLLKHNFKTLSLSDYLHVFIFAIFASILFYWSMLLCQSLWNFRFCIFPANCFRSLL